MPEANLVHRRKTMIYSFPSDKKRLVDELSQGVFFVAKDITYAHGGVPKRLRNEQKEQ